MNDNSHSQKKFFDNSIIKKLYKKFQSNIEFQMRAYSLPKLSKFGFFKIHYVLINQFPLTLYISRYGETPLLDCLTYIKIMSNVP